MRLSFILLLLAGLFLYLAIPNAAKADTVYYHDGFALGIGHNLGTENNATEDKLFSLKFRQSHWQYGIDHCLSGNIGGTDDVEFQFLWVSYIEEFARPDLQKYGLYAGIGGGTFLNPEEDFVENQAGPFAIVGWDLTTWIGFEGKIGWFGRNNWATGTVYYYF